MSNYPDDPRLREILGQIRDGSLSLDEAMRRLRALPFEDLGFAKLDTHRRLRTGFPEVIFCQGKTTEQVVAVVARLAGYQSTVLATRATPEQAQAVQQVLPQAIYHETARLIVYNPIPLPQQEPEVIVVSAGTADTPVAEEAAATAEAMGHPVRRIYDVGVAGLHRLLCHAEHLFSARAIVVVAGMEGALASVVGGLVACPVIAVPTSVGYGASFQGLAALLSMLNCCAAGVAVVNIDNGFGAGYLAAVIASASGPGKEAS